MRAALTWSRVEGVVAIRPNSFASAQQLQTVYRNFECEPARRMAVHAAGQARDLFEPVPQGVVVDEQLARPRGHVAVVPQVDLEGPHQRARVLGVVGEQRSQRLLAEGLERPA